MYRKIVILFCFFLFAIGPSAFCQAFKVYDTIPIRHGTSKLRLYKNIDRWFEKERGTKLLGKNWKERKFKGKGYFPYTNLVKIPDIYLSSHAAEKTKGSIVFSIDVEIQDSIILVTFSNFIHEARFSEYGTSSFGRLMDYEKVPSGKCMEVEEWCNAVWADMKAWSIYETKERAKRMIPSTLIRKRTYKIEEIKEEEKTKEQQADPLEYLNIDNYLLKDTEGKYADYNKDPEEIAAEKAAAAAALAEKERKKAKDLEDEYLEDEYGEYEETENSAPIQENPQPEIPQGPSDSDYDEYDDEEILGPTQKNEKKNKGKKEKPAKKEKAAKSKDSDDDYDDYDDDY